MRAIKKATEHLIGLGHASICYLARPRGVVRRTAMRWRGLQEAGLELDLQVRRVGPFLPTIRGGAVAAEQWLARPTTAVIAYNDLMAIGFVQAVIAAGRRVPADVSVIGFDNIVDGASGRTPPDHHRRPAGQPGVGGGRPSRDNRSRDRAETRSRCCCRRVWCVRGSTGPRRAR